MTEQTSLALGEPPSPAALLERELIEFCTLRRLRAVLPDTIAAGDSWGANCGPMSLAAVLGLARVEDVRELVHPFMGWMSPTDIRRALDRAGARHRETPHPAIGLMRVQWLGPWCDAGVDPRAAYRYTHWIGIRGDHGAREVYDATPNRWIPIEAWARWCPTLWPRRATGWKMVNSIEVETR